MDIINTIKEAVIPDANSIPNSEHATADQAESNVPGAFPDADDAELGRQLEQKDQEAVAKRSHKHADSGVDLLGTGAAAPRLASSLAGAPGDYTPPPDIGTWSRTGDAAGQGLTQEANPSYLASRDTPNRTGTTPNVGQGHSGDRMKDVEEVSVQHLGNEGKSISGGLESQGGFQSASKAQDDLPASFEQTERNTAPTESSTTAARDPVAEYARQQMGTDNNGSAAQSGGNTGSRVLQEAANLSEPTPPHQRSTHSEVNLRDPVVDAARQQQQPTSETRDLSATSQSGGNTDSHVLQEAAAAVGADTGVSEGGPPHQQHRNTQSEPAAGFSGGIHNGVFGAGSEDVQGEGIVGQHERSSQYRKGDISSSITGVSESGLGQGGVHNGVVGLGSREEETLRQSLDGKGQRDEF